jgi:fatty acid desaturase
MHAFARLKAEFKARGFYGRPTRRLLAELALHLAIFGAGTVIVLWSPHPVVWLLGMVLVTLGSLGVATNTHTSAHFATSEKDWVNRALTYFGYPFFLQFSATYWWHKHHVIHHPAPNVIGVDADVNLLPYFAYSERDLEQAGPVRRRYFAVQWVVLPLALLLNGVNMLRRGWSFVLGALADPRRRRAGHWIDLGVLALHVLGWLVVPSIILGPGPVLAFYVVRAGMMGFALFAVLAPGHYPAEAAALEPGSRSQLSFFRLHTLTTVNFRTGPYGRLLCSGLEYHIEHHLFPRVSHVYYPKMSTALRTLCERYGYDYHSMGWGEVLWKVCRTFRHPKTILRHPESLVPFP